MLETVSHNNNFAPQISEYIKDNEALTDPITRRDYFEHLSGDDFIDMTQQVASLILTGNSNERRHFDGASMVLMDQDLPDQRDKEQLLRETWDTAQELLRDRSISDNDALEYAALIAAGGVLLTHAFDDGNGRTSRILSYIIARGGQDGQEIERVSRSMSHEWHVAPSRRTNLRERTTYKHEQPQIVNWEWQMDETPEYALGNMIADSSSGEAVVRRFLDTADDETRLLIETCVTRDENGNMLSLDADKMLSVVVNDPEHGIRNAQNLIDLERQCRASYVRGYLAAMKSNKPNEIKILKGTRLSDLAEVNPRYRAKGRVVAEVVGRRSLNGLILPRDEAVAEHRSHSDLHTRQMS